MNKEQKLREEIAKAEGFIAGYNHDSSDTSYADKLRQKYFEGVVEGSDLATSAMRLTDKP